MERQNKEAIRTLTAKTRHFSNSSKLSWVIPFATVARTTVQPNTLKVMALLALKLMAAVQSLFRNLSLFRRLFPSSEAHHYRILSDIFLVLSRKRDKSSKMTILT